MSTLSICQCDVHNARECDSALFLNERLSDLTINFTSHNISFPAHRLLMAKKSSFFENLFYGPMAMNEKEWKIRDNDIEPEVFKIMLAHLYDLNLLEENIEMTLQIYKLADFYMIDSLKSQCLKHLQDTISKDRNGSKLDYQYILEWAKEFGFNDIKTKVFECLSTKLCESDYHSDDHSFLLNLTLETCTEFVSLCKATEIVLCFKEYWRNPTNPLSSEVLMSLVEGLGRKGELLSLQGCFSSQVVNKIITTEEESENGITIFVNGILYLSLIDNVHSQALYECFKDKNISDDDLADSVTLHIRCNSISPKDLVIWSSNIHDLYLSNVDEDSLHWAATTIISLNPNYLHLPKCSLSIDSFKALIEMFVPVEIKLISIDICSAKIAMKYWDELRMWFSENKSQIEDINIRELEEECFGW